MRASSMNRYAEILQLEPDLSSTVLGNTWIGIKASESSGPATGLRSPASINVVARFTSLLTQGRYLRHDGRLLYINSANDPSGTRERLNVAADEFVGQSATYNGKACRVHLTHNAPWLDDMGAVTAYKTRAEVALIEVGRPQVNDQITVDGTAYNVIGYESESDDGIVRGLWLERV